MAIQCPTCGIRLNVAPRLEGKRIRCSACKTIISPVLVAAKVTETEPLPVISLDEPHDDLGASTEPLSVIELSETDAAITERTLIPYAAPVDADVPAVRCASTSRRAGVKERPQPTARSRFRWVFLLLGACLAGLGVIGFLFAMVYLNDFIGTRPSGSFEVKVEPPPPPPNLDKLLTNPAPPQIDADTQSRVLRATAHLRTTRVGNVMQEGSGFFAAEPGLVFTNAHVVGMGAAGCSSPVRLEVILNSGAPDEKILRGSVLTANWVTDLAVVRVMEGAEHWPTPLTISSSNTLNEQQKIYVSAFALGQGITVSELSVSALRKDSGSNIQQIQVSGDMQPGNSGGPVVDSRGLVVGVAISMIRGTRVNLAVPAENLNGLLRGSVEDIQFGEAYLEGADTRLPVTARWVDTMLRLREVKLEVWAGDPDTGRPASFKMPEPLPGDGPRAVFPVAAKNGKASADLRLPELKPNQVLWVQPVLTDVGNTVRWAAASHYKPTGRTPLERTPATLQFVLADQAERTIKLTYVDTIKVTMGDDEMMSKTDIVADGLEVLRKNNTGAEAQLHFGPCTYAAEHNRNKLPIDPQLTAALKGAFVRYTADAGGALKSRTNPNIGSGLSQQKRRELAQLVHYIANTYEQTCVFMPNRLVQPRETWETVVRLTPAAGFANGELELKTTCTYEGRRVVQGENQAVITVAGVLWGEIPVRPLGGVFTGRIYYSVDKGYATEADLKLQHEFGRGNMFTSRTILVTLTRAPGNSLGIEPIDVK